MHSSDSGSYNVSRSAAGAQRLVAVALLTTLGIRIVERTAERCVIELPWSDAVQQPMRLFHAGAILALADSAATTLLRSVLATAANANPHDLDPAAFPLGIQISSNIIRARRDCTLRAEFDRAPRRTAVVETKVRDDEGKLVAAVTTTHYLPGGRAAGA